MKEVQRKTFYNALLSQVISSCKKYLFLGNNFGDISVLSTKDITTSNDDEYNRHAEHSAIKPIHSLKTGVLPINSLAFHQGFLIVGTVGSIFGYVWDEQKLQLTKKAWEIKIPTVPEAIETSDINHLVVDHEQEHLYVGCGDNNIYAFNLEGGKLIRDFKGHKDYVHCLAKLNNNLYSASEDGSILFWDILEEKFIHKIEPYKVESLARPEYGNWQGTVSVTNDWLICGGGPRASMWHPRSMECTNVLPFPGKVHCSEFIDDVIVIGGEHQLVHQYSFNGLKFGEIPTSGAAVFSIAWQNEPYKFLSLGGTSNAIDICTHFNYRDLIVKIYKAEN